MIVNMIHHPAFVNLAHQKIILFWVITIVRSPVIKYVYQDGLDQKAIAVRIINYCLELLRMHYHIIICHIPRENIGFFKANKNKDI